jgi:hypothetical protein
MKSEALAVNASKMWINFASGVENFGSLGLLRILGIGLVEWREIGWGRNWRLVRNIKVRDLPLLFMADGKKQGLTPFPVS